MSDDELKSFKISDATPRVADKRPPKDDAAAQAASVGFPNVEAQVEADGPALEGMRTRYALFEELQKTGKTAKEKAGARKAALAYERAYDLLEHLLATKSQMLGDGEGEG